MLKNTFAGVHEQDYILHKTQLLPSDKGAILGFYHIEVI